MVLVKDFVYPFLAFIWIRKLLVGLWEWLAGWLVDLSWFPVEGVVCGSADAQLKLSVSDTAQFYLKVHVALAVVTVSLAYVTFIYPFPSFV